MRARPTLIGIGAVLVAQVMGGSCPWPSAAAAVANYDGTRPVVLFGSGSLTTPNSTSKAITYNPALAPVGAAVTATIVPTSEGSTTELTVFGLLPNHGYSVYAYTRSCGATITAAGSRFEVRPAHTLSTDSPNTIPHEIGLTVRTDPVGTGTSRATVPFALTDPVPGSMVVHDAESVSDPDQPDTAGKRIACVTLSRR